MARSWVIGLAVVVLVAPVDVARPVRAEAASTRAGFSSQRLHEAARVRGVVLRSPGWAGAGPSVWSDRRAMRARGSRLRCVLCALVQADAREVRRP